MMSRLLIAIMFLLPCRLALAAELPSAETQDAPAPRVYRISGIVLSTRDGAPIPRCRMEVSQSDSISGLPRRDPAPAQSSASPPGRSVRRGRPLQLRPSDPSDPSNSVLTDSLGHFTLTVAKPGMWRLTGTAHGFRTQAYDEHEGFWSGVVLTPAAPEITLTFRMTPDGAISGIVFDEAGEAVRGAQVTVTPVRPAAPNSGVRQTAPAGTDITDDRGVFEVAGLTPGPYTVKVNAHPWYSTSASGRMPTPTSSSPDPSLDLVYPETWFPGTISPNEAETIVLAPGEQRQADLHLTPVPSIHLLIPRPQTGQGGGGSDEDQPRGIPFPIVSRASTSGVGYMQDISNNATPTGWDIGGLSPGNYQVRLPGGDESGQRLSQISVGPGATNITLDGASSTTSVTVNIDGVAGRDVRQVLFVDTQSGQSYNSGGGDGDMRRNRGGGDEDDAPTVRTVDLPPGTYEVYLSGSTGLYLAGLSATGAQVVGRTIVIAGGAPKLTVRASRGMGEVVGLARRDGKPVSGALVLLVPAGYGKPENVAPIERDETNTDGSFQIRNVIPGPYILVAIDGGWGVDWRDTATLTHYLTAGTPIALQSGGIAHNEIQAVGP